MTPRAWIVVGCIAAYLYWCNQSEAQATQLGAAGTPVGSTPVSTIATSTNTTLDSTNPLQSVLNAIGNVVTPAPTVQELNRISGGPARPVGTVLY